MHLWQTTEMTTTIYADGGPSIGYGHLIRTSALAKEYLDRGHTIEYITATPDSAREVVPDNVQISPISEPTELVSHVGNSDTDLLVTDSYKIDHKIQQRLRSTVSKLAVIMDQNPHPICCDVLINGNLYASELEYEWSGTEPEWCLGTEYLILREEIRNYLGESPPWHEKPQRAMITMGGGDQKNITPTAVEAIKEFDLVVDVIIGPGFSQTQEQEINSATEDASADLNVVRDPDDFAKRMFLSDFALSTASTTTYELLALSTPIISVQVADNQKLIADALRNQNLAFVIDDLYNKKHYWSGIEQYINNPEIRKDQLKRGRRLIYQEGIERTYKSLIQT